MKYDHHMYYLNEFIKPKNLEPALALCHKSLDELISIIVEPQYFTSAKMTNQSMCDYLFLFSGNECIPGELKGSTSQRQKAKSQLKQGKLFAKTVLDYKVTSGLFIVYYVDSYQCEKIKIPR